MRRMRSVRARVLRWTSIAVATVVVAAVLSGYFALRVKLDKVDHIARIDAQHRPPRYNDALNLLLIGSDSRHGHNGVIGGRYGCNCSDTLMLVHVSPGRKQVTVISIPRDTMVPSYACSPWEGLPGQAANPDALERINGTLAAGGPECVRETVEQQTGVYIDDVLELDFTGFQEMINSVGGVNICVPFPIHNVISLAGGTGLNLSAGEHHIYGRVALQFWRTRENIANGSDIDRIARDQYFLAQLLKGVLHSGLLHSPSKLYDVLGDVAGNLTTDASDTDLLHIATSLNGISLTKVQFITAPWTTYQPDPNEVQFAQPQADALFWAIAHDTKLPKVTKTKGGGTSATPLASVSPAATPTASATPGASPSASSSPAAGGQPLTITPSDVNVMLLDGSSGPDLTSAVQTQLTSRGFTVVGSGYANSSDYTSTVIQYASAADLAAANTVKQQFGPAKLQLDASLQAGTIQVILGSSFTKLAPPASTSQAISGLSTNYGGITANIRCRNSAFYGYYDQAPVSMSCTC
jgi:LCP family protein required for cell wall assembly